MKAKMVFIILSVLLIASTGSQGHSEGQENEQTSKRGTLELRPSFDRTLFFSGKVCPGFQSDEIYIIEETVTLQKILNMLEEHQDFFSNSAAEDMCRTVCVPENGDICKKSSSEASPDTKIPICFIPVENVSVTYDNRLGLSATLYEWNAALEKHLPISGNYVPFFELIHQGYNTREHFVQIILYVEGLCSFF